MVPVSTLVKVFRPPDVMRALVLISLTVLLVAGCAEVGDLRQIQMPPDRTEPSPTPKAEMRSAISFEQEAFYTKLEGDLLARGLLRSEGGGPDVPFTDEMVARNFEALAFSEEFSLTGGLISPSGQASTLHRWSKTVLIEPIFGDSVEPEKARKDTAIISAYAQRLAAVTEHSVETTARGGNFAVMVLHEQDLARVGEELKARLPEISEAEISFVATLPIDIYCLVFTSDPANDGEITRAVAIIRAELPEALRISCYHEELAQGLGLANDSDFARPSIFNDDDEFGRLTTHDEYLLSILYDDRLTPGMTETEAAPLVRQAARARLAPES